MGFDGEASTSLQEVTNHSATGRDLAPGTVLLEDLDHHAGVEHGQDGVLVLQPQPSADPNDPLNWTMRRKTVNFSIIAFYTLWIFVILDIGTVVWSVYVEDWGLTYGQLNNAYAANLAGLAAGCILFIPFALKFGRRPVYLISTFVVFLCAVWQACLNDLANIIGSQVVSGLFGAIAEALCYMTIGDIFFVHQRGKATAITGFFTNVGAFLGPVAAGYIAKAQGWRWMYWWCAIFLGINLVVFLFFYEETKFIAPSIGVAPCPSRTNNGSAKHNDENSVPDLALPAIGSLETGQHGIDHSIPMKTYRQRLALTTITPGGWGKFFKHMYQPILLLFMFPAVAFTALQLGSLLSWYAIMVTTQATYFALPPYNFGPIGIGLLNIPAFVGGLLGFIWGGPVSDYSIVYFAKRNKGVFEPEMRLYIAIVPALTSPIGIFLYGYTTAEGRHWIIPCVGCAIFGFGLAAISALSVSYLIDSYKEIIGDGFVAVVLVRNGLSMVVTFTITPWFEGMGFRNSFTLIGCLCLAVNLLCLPMIYFGKSCRVACAKKYERMIGMQFNPRGW